MTQIITDSVADFEPEELQRLDVACVPISVAFGESSYRENVDLTKDDFYRLLRQRPEFPRTSQPAPGDFLRAFSPAKERGDAAVMITMSQRFGGIYQGALLAKELLDYPDAYVIDSRGAAGGERILVETAVRLRDEGKTPAEIAASVERLRDRIVLFACPDTMDNLRRGGRVPALVAAIGSAAHVKPVLHIAGDGEVVIAARELGRRRAMRFFAQQMHRRPPDPAFPVYVMYSDVRENAELLAELLRQEGFSPDGRLINVGVAMGTHIGPNAFGLAYVETDRGAGHDGV